MEWMQLIIYSLIYLLLFAIIEMAYHRFKLSTEFTRKIVHICAGLIALTFPLFFEHLSGVLILCALFLLVLFVSKKIGILSSINNVERATKGSTIFPIIVAFCFVIYAYQENYLFYYLPILILALCDPIASFTGRKLKFGTYTVLGNKKTLAGNLGFFLSCFVICFFVAFGPYFNPHSSFTVSTLMASVTIAFTATIAEGISVNGYDNLTIPLTVLATLYILQEIPLID